MILRLHTETACGAAARWPCPRDLDPDQCLILLREKGETVRWQPVSPTLMADGSSGSLQHSRHPNSGRS